MQEDFPPNFLSAHLASKPQWDIGDHRLDGREAGTTTTTRETEKGREKGRMGARVIDLITSNIKGPFSTYALLLWEHDWICVTFDINFKQEIHANMELICDNEQKRRWHIF